VKFRGLGMPVLRTGIPFCVVVSMAIHVAVLTLAELSQSSTLKVYRPGAAGPLRLRIMPAGEPSSDSGKQANEPLRWPKPITAVNPSAKINADASRTAEVHLQEPKAHHKAREIPTGVSAATSIAPGSSAPAAGPPGYADYLPKIYLSVGPEPLTPIEIEAPFGRFNRVTVTVVLSLFIDEYGKVQKIEVESTDVMQSFVDAAREAFERVTFKPGTLHGKAVRSVIKIAVEFEPL
jgi:periplasmic protein TonB